MKAIPIFFWLLMFPLTLIFAQTEEEEEVEEPQIFTTISLSEMNRIINSGEDEIFLQDFIIKPSAEDKQFLTDKIFFSIYEIPSPADKALSLYLYNCRFEFDLDAAISFKGWKFNRLNIVRTNTTSPLSFDDCSQTGAYPIRFENCVFNHVLRFTGTENSLQHLRMEKCVFSHQLIVNQNVDDLKLINSHFTANTNWLAGLDPEQTYYQLDLHKTQIESLELYRVQFEQQLPENVYSVNLERAVLGKVLMQFIRAHTFNFTDATIEKSLLADSLEISHFIAVQNFDFPAENTNLPWYNLAGEKLCVFISEGTDKHLPYQPKSAEEVSRTLFFNELMACYKKINVMYEARGDKMSANASYIEIKDLQTRQQKQLYKTTGEPNYYIGYQLNVMAKFLSDYATNPARSLIIIFWIVFIFALLYMITYSEWDGINYAYFERQYAILAEYFTTDKSLRELYCSNQEEQKEHYETLRNAYLSKKSELPAAIRLMGTPLYGAWKFRHKLTLWIYDKIEFLHGSWNSLPNKRKILISGFTAMLMLFYLCFILIVKFINSYMLSLNILVSLGFGKTPEQIVPLYISIVQGFVGWFVLTIFSITLLSQLLQNV